MRFSCGDGGPLSGVPPTSVKAFSSPADRVGATESGHHVEAHGPGGALDDPHRRLDLEGVEVLHLELGDLLHLGLGDGADLLAVRLRRSLVHPRGLLEQVVRGRRLGDEGEGAVLVDGDLCGDHRARLRGGALVVGAAGLHGVLGVRTQRGAHRRRRRGLARLDLQADDGLDLLLAHGTPAVAYLRRSTWRRSSSTGVSRPHMFTSTLSLPLAASISTTLPWKSVKGPSTTRTFSPTWYSTVTLSGAFSLVLMMLRISLSWSGTGLFPEPTKEVTPGVLRTTYQDSSDITMLTRMYPGKM